MNNNNIVNNMLQMMTNGQNPNQILENAFKQNPNIQAIFNQAQQSGMSMKDFTLHYAKQNNMNIQPILNLLSQRGIKL